MNWDILDTKAASAEENMRFDEELLASLNDCSRPILHFYEWDKDSLTYGYFLKPETLLDLDAVQKRGISVARRPTGGGVVFHLWDLAFSVLMPSHHPCFSFNSLKNYAFVNSCVLKAVKKFLKGGQNPLLTQEDMIEWNPSCRNFCMAKPTKYDVLLEGRKIAGAAQRKKTQGFLHQGTISLILPSKEILQEVLLDAECVLEAMMTHTFPLLGAKASPLEMIEAKRTLKELLKESFIYEPATDKNSYPTD